MDRHSKNIDDLFKEELGSYTETPPPAAWDALEKKLAARPPKGNRLTYRRLGYLALLLMTAFVSVTIARKLSGSTEASNPAVSEATPIAKVQDAAPATIPATIPAAVTDAKNENEKTNDHKAIPQPATTVEPTTAKKTSAVTGKPLVSTTPPHTSPHSTLSSAPAKVIQPVSAPVAAINAVAGNTQEEAAVTEKIVPQAQAQTTQAPAVAVREPEKNKETKAKTVVTTVVEQKPLVKVKPHFNRFEAGIKGGIEKGFTSDAATKYLASPYLQFNLSPKFAIMTQPSVKVATVSSRGIGNAQSYYKANNDGETKFVDSTPVYIPLGGVRFDTLWLRNYSYTQTHDSIVKTNTFGGTYMEVDLPILLKYGITRNFSLYAGVNVTYGKTTGVTEHTNITHGIGKTADSFTLEENYKAAPTPPSLGNVIRYTGSSISNYTGPQYPVSTDATFRLGYMLGFSYEFTHRWLFDGLIQQGTAKSNTLGGYNINTAISAPYFRFTLGYKLTK